MTAAAALCCWLVCGIASAWSQTAERQLVSLGRHVACRTAPSLSAGVVARLDVADLVDVVDGESEPPDWVQVAVGGGPTCFVSRRLVTPFDPAAPERAVVAIVESTARLTGRMPFGRMAAVHALFENRWQGITVEGSAEMELLELQVLDRTARTIVYWEDVIQPITRPWNPLTAYHRQDIGAWMERHDRPPLTRLYGRSWGVLSEAFWTLHDKYRDDPLADRIAGTASQQYPDGECEGFLPCELRSWLSPRFEYLRRHPQGTYVTETLEYLLYYLTSMDNNAPPVSRICHGRGSEEFTALAVTIRTILDRVDHGLARDVEAMLDTFARPC